MWDVRIGKMTRAGGVLVLLLAAATARAVEPGVPTTQGADDWQVCVTSISRLTGLYVPRARSNFILQLAGQLPVPPDAVVLTMDRGQFTQVIAAKGSTPVPMDQAIAQAADEGRQADVVLIADALPRTAPEGYVVAMKLAGQGVAPAAYQRISGALVVRVARKIQTVDVQLSRIVAGKPVLLARGFTISASQEKDADHGPDSYHYRLSRLALGDPEDELAATNSSPPMVMKMQLLDQADQVIANLKPSYPAPPTPPGSPKPSIGCDVVFRALVKDDPTSPRPVKLRVQVATEVETKTCPFELNDVALP